MTKKEEVIAYCLTFDNVYEDYPFHDLNWCVIRHKGSKKVFAWIFHLEFYYLGWKRAKGRDSADDF